MTALRHSLTRWLTPMLLGLAGLAATSAAQAGDIGVSIGFSQPGVYGRVDIGRYPHPVLIAPQPVYVGRPIHREPVYLWVPPDHRRHWNRHCNRYGACGAPVYFVEDRWYRGHVVHHHHQDRHRHHDHRRHDRHDRHDHRDHHDRDRGHGHRH